MASDNAMYSNYKVKGYIGDSSVASKLGDGGYISNGTVYSPQGSWLNQKVNEVSAALHPSNGDNGGGGGGSSTSSAASTPSSSGSFDLAGYLEGLRAQQRADAEAAYARARSNLNDAYNSASSAYGNIYNSGVDQLGRSYNNSRGKINSEATDAFRQAYVNRMLSEKNLGQKMAALGMSGGASESTLAGLINNYGNARNGIQRTLDTNLGDLEMKYQGNLADLYNAYQQNMANIASQRANQLANLEMQLANLNANMGGDYYSAMMSNIGNLQKAANSAASNQASYTPTAQEVTNALTPASVQQANDMGASLTNAAYDAWKRNQEDQEGTARRSALASSLFDSDMAAKYADYLSKALLGTNLLGAVFR